MKRKSFSLAIGILALSLWACNDSANTDSASGSDTGSNNATNNTPTMSNTPLTMDDSTFVMEAAIGGMMEVEAGNMAQQNAASQRVKDFGAMLVRDHGKANDELKSFASSRGLSLPTALPADKQDHMTEMSKMKGSSFDKHFIDMMVDDHRKDIDKFEKQSNSGGDAELKTWAGKTLPVLKMHKDSIDAIKKGM